MKFGTGDRTPRAKFHVYRGNVSPLRDEKPIFGLLSKNNTGMAALCAGLPVIIIRFVKRLKAGIQTARTNGPSARAVCTGRLHGCVRALCPHALCTRPVQPCNAYFCTTRMDRSTVQTGRTPHSFPLQCLLIYCESYYFTY